MKRRKAKARSAQVDNVGNCHRLTANADTVKKMVEKYGISARTARRWIAGGVDPSARCIRRNANGRIYSFTPRRANANPLCRNFNAITWALNALERTAGQSGITADDLERLERVEGRVFEITEAWRSAIAEGSGKGGRA